jgi:hypothetical protein
MRETATAGQVSVARRARPTLTVTIEGDVRPGMSTPIGGTEPGPFDDQSLAVRGVIAAVLAVGGNLALLVAATSAGVGEGFRPFAAAPVVFLTVVGVLGAVGSYALLERRVSTPTTTFRLVTVAVLAVSFVPDLTLLVFDEAATVLGVLVLVLMHVVAAVVCIAVVPDWTSDADATREAVSEPDGVT